MDAERGELAAGREVLFGGALRSHDSEDPRHDRGPEGEHARGYLLAAATMVVASAVASTVAELRLPSTLAITASDR